MKENHVSKFIAAVASRLPHSQDGWIEFEQALASGTALSRISDSIPPTPLRTHLEERPEVWDLAKRTLDWCEQNNVVITYPGAFDYPREFLELPQPPRFLSYRGEPAWLARKSLSIVGSRDPSRATLSWLDENLQEVLRHSDIAIASGGARGIDQAAHRISLRAGRPTLAFLPSGLGAVYPSDFESWIDEILSGGGSVISEFPPEAMMFRGHFQRRNRMIAAIGKCLFVAQAARKSGTLITARQALELHRPIAVLPASPQERNSLGGLDLLFDGAALVRDAADLGSFFAS